MKRKIIGLILVATVLAPVVWYAGVVMECEYPYAVTMFRAAHSKTVAGDDAAAVIASSLGVRRSRLDWHRCSFCENFDGELPGSMVWVQVSIVPRENFVFAFDARRGILYPVDSKTEAAFPKMRGIMDLAWGTNGNPNKSLPISKSRIQLFEKGEAHVRIKKWKTTEQQHASSLSWG